MGDAPLLLLTSTLPALIDWSTSPPSVSLCTTSAPHEPIARLHARHPAAIWLGTVPLPPGFSDLASLGPLRSLLGALRMVPVFIDCERYLLWLSGFCASVLAPVAACLAPR